MSVGENIRRYRKLRGMTQAQLAEAVGLTEGAVRHYESGIRAVKPELLESIADTLGVSVNALKDYGVENAGDLMSLLVRLEDSFGIVPAADGAGLSLNPKAPHAPKPRRRSGCGQRSARSWRTARSTPENTRTGKPRCSGSPHIAINEIESGWQTRQCAPRIPVSAEFLLPVACRDISGVPGE